MHVLPFLFLMNHMLTMNVSVCSSMPSVACMHVRWGLELSSPFVLVSLHVAGVGRQGLQRPMLDAAVTSV